MLTSVVGSQENSTRSDLQRKIFPQWQSALKCKIFVVKDLMRDELQ